MENPRRTFVLTVHGDESETVLENLLTQERVRLTSLALVPRQVTRWLGQQAPPHKPQEEK